MLKSKVKRKKRKIKRTEADDAKDILNLCLKVKEEFINELNKTETLEKYSELIKKYHDVLELESKTKNELKNGLRNN